MSVKQRFSRRDFLKAGVAAGAGLTIALYLPGRLSSSRKRAIPPLGPNAWIAIDSDGTVTLALDRTEMGQGILTSLAMILAEELDADWSQVTVAPVVDNPAAWPRTLSTAASRSVRDSYDMLRNAAAAAREMLVAAAAEQWVVDTSTCRTQQGFVVHAPSGRKLGYGSLVPRAKLLDIPEHPRLKDPREFKLIGHPIKRLDTPSKVDGTATYGIDVRVPGMLYASIERSPVFGGKVRRLDATGTKNTPGVRHVVSLEGLGQRKRKGWNWRTYTESGVAVLADGYWQAVTGRRALKVEWDGGINATLNSEQMTARFASLAERPGKKARREGDAGRALTRVGKRVEAIYEVPLLHHATMEPMNCTADVRQDGCDIWAPTQKQTHAQALAAEITGLPKDRIRIHTPLTGGGFGRRQENDYVAEAVRLSQMVGRPVQVIWSREDDVQHGFYRPPVYNKLAAGIDDSGRLVAWTHRIVGLSIMDWKYGSVQRGIDRWLVEKAADLPYRIPNIQVDQVIADFPVPRGFWRSTGASHNVYVTECFFDEVARAAGRDPYEMRRELLQEHPRQRAVLDLAAEKAGWGKPLPRGHFQGIASVHYAEAFVAKVAEVSVDAQGKPRVHRIVCAVDCGPVVNPDTVAAQMEGGVAFGLTAVLYGQITIADGGVRESNFHDYPLLRMSEMPVVETHILQSNAEIGAIGDPAVPAVAPAVCNAIFAATGTPVRRLPILPSTFQTP